MALIKCPECGKEISDKATCCIHCGCPMDYIVKQINDNLVKVQLGQVLKQDSVTEEKIPKIMKISEGNITYHIKDNILIGVSGEENKIVIPECVEIINEKVFKDHRNIKTILLPKNLREIKDKAFANCKNLKSIVLPNSIVYMGDSVLLGCNKILSINIPSSIINNTNWLEQCKLLKNIIIPKEISSLLLLNNIGHGVKVSYKGSMKELLAVFEKTGSISYSGNIKCNNGVLHVKISNKGRFFKEEEECYIPTKEDLEHVSYLINNRPNEKVEKDHKIKTTEIKTTKTIKSGFPVYLGNNQKITPKKNKSKIDKNQKKQRFIAPCFLDDKSVTDEEFLKAVNNITYTRKKPGDIFSAKVEIIKDDYIIVSTPNFKKEDQVLKENLLHNISSYKVGSHIRLKVISMNPLRLKEFDGDNSSGELDKPLLQSIDDKDNKVSEVNNNNDTSDFINGLSNELQKNECINSLERIEKKDRRIGDKFFNLLEFDEEKTNNDDFEEDDYLF